MEDNLQWKVTSKWKTTSNGRQPSMEDNLKILNVEYLSHHLLDLTQILDLSIKTMEDNIRCKDDLKAGRIILVSS